MNQTLKIILSKLSVIIRDRPLKLGDDINLMYLLDVFFVRALGILRGFLSGKMGSCLGRRVILRKKKNILFGSGVLIGDYVLLDGLGGSGISLGSRVSIGAFSRLSVSGSLSILGKGILIGEDVAVGDFSHIGGAGGVSIGRDTIAGAYLSIHPENHNFDDITKPIRLQGVNRQGIVIGENCWIGAKVTILDGVKLGDGCVVAAGSVVRGHFPNNVIIGGVPAKILKQR